VGVLFCFVLFCFVLGTRGGFEGFQGVDLWSTQALKDPKFATRPLFGMRAAEPAVGTLAAGSPGSARA
jgi:hypothetical protein